MVTRDEAVGEQRQTLPTTITTALIVATVAVIGNAVTSTIGEAVAGAAAGAAAGVAILQLLWKEGAETGTAAVAVPAVAGGLAGTATALFLSLLGAQSLTGSAVTGALAGAAIVTVARTKLQLAIKIIEWLQWLLKVIKRALPAAVIGGPALAAGAAEIFNLMSQAEITASGAAASELTASEIAALVPGASGPAVSGPRAASGPASSEPGVSATGLPGPAAPESASSGPEASGVSTPGSSGPPASGPASSGCPAPESATSGPVASESTPSGPAEPESASSGPEASGVSTPLGLASGAAVSAGAKAAVAGAIGGLAGGLLARAVSGSNRSQQKDRSQGKSTEMKNVSSQTDESSQIDESSKTDKSLETKESSQTDESSKSEKSLQTDESSQTDKSSQTSLMPDSPENTDKDITENGLTEKKIGYGSNYSAKGETKDKRPIGNSPDQQLQQLYKLHLNKNKNKLSRADVLQLTNSLQSLESCAEDELVQVFIHKLLMMDYRARYIKTHEMIEQCNELHRDERDVCYIFDEMSLCNEGASEYDRIHPMDVQMAVFHCADGLLKQLMVTKLSQCQFALPLLVPDPFTQQIEFPLWTFRQINKSWKIRNNNNELVSQIQPIYKAQTPMVFFFRFGSVSSSKSQLMNSLINEKHNTFFHRNCPGSSRTRVLMDGVVEIAWFCPSGKITDKFTDCVAFCNLHGDAGHHERQLQIFTEMASVNVVILPKLDRSDKSIKNIKKLYMDTKPLICLFSEDGSSVNETKNRKYKIGLKDRNQSDVSEELRRAINDCLSEPSSTFRLEDVSKHSDIRIDEEDDEDCRRGREEAQIVMNLLENKDLREIKESFLPHQEELWHEWSQKNKELHRGCGDEREMDIRGNQKELMEIRKQQHESDISEFMKLIIKEMSTDVPNKMFFLKWLGNLLDEHTSADLAALHHKYNKKWSAVEKLKKNNKTNQVKAEQAELERIYKDLKAATFGLEHIMRDIGQIYESCESVKENKKDLPVHFSSLPSLAAEMMISGFPLELMDGDAAHVPVIWISAVLDQLTQKLGDQTRVFVLSVLRLQSSGKSTMLNAMFGLEFAVSAGRCTRGAFMQLVKVSDEMKTQMKFDYILVVNSEGLCALELAGKTKRHHDNELATFVVGLGNLTLVNIFGENPSEMQDILQIVVQAFMRMKKVRLNPNCVFVHQNVSDVTSGEKNMEGRRRLQETLDEMTKLAAKDEVCDAECFSDVIKFDVQKDVKYFAQLWEGSPPMAPPNPNYCENIQELKKSIQTYASKSHGIMLTDLKDRIRDLWEAILKEHFIFRFRNSLEISAYRKLETEYSKWSWSLCSAMIETENKLHNKIENNEINEVEETDIRRELKETSKEVEKSMSEFFEKDRDTNILIQWKTSFETKIKQIQENIVRETIKKLNKILQKQDLRKKIDTQRKHHENTLYEKSKELALNFKDQANEEERVKKEFDLFWEQSVKIIIRDTPPSKGIDIMRDVREILCDIYKSAPVDHWRESQYIFFVSGFSDYLKIKKLSGFRQDTNVYTPVKDKTDYIHSQEVQDQIMSFIADVVQQTDNRIQSFNISKMGYNIGYIQQLIDHIKRTVTDHQEGPVKYVFKNDFFMDLVYSIFNLANKTISDQHRQFREANDPVVYCEKKREEYYSTFQKYCDGATSAVTFGEIICQKLKEPIEQSVYIKTSRNLAYEMRFNYKSLDENQSDLKRQIWKILAEEKDYEEYMDYLDNYPVLLKYFFEDQVSQYITDNFSDSVLPKMERSIELLQQKIMEAAHKSTEHVQVNSGDAGLWLKSFTQQLSDKPVFTERDLNGVKHEDVDFSILEDVVKEKLLNIMSDISSRFTTRTFPEKLHYILRPDELLIEHFTRCHWDLCSICQTSTNIIEHPDDASDSVKQSCIIL